MSDKNDVNCRWNGKNDRFYEILDHTADVKFRVFGRSLEELFINSSLTFWEFVCNCKELDMKEFENKDYITDNEITLNFNAPRLDDLFFDFLSELVYLFDTYGFFSIKKYVNCKVVEKTREQEKSFYLTFKFKPLRCKSVKEEVKAMTYNDLVVKCDSKLCYVEFVLDL